MRARRALTAAVAVALLSQTLPAAGQWGRSSTAQTCRTLHGRMVCYDAYWSRGAAGNHAYDRWSDGSPAIGGSSAPHAYQFPQYLGGHNSWYGFGH